MSIATHDGETYAAGDTIYLCDDGGVYRDQLDVPSSGSGGSPITYVNASGDSPVISGADVISGNWAGPDGNGEYTDDSINTESMLVIVDGIRWAEGTVASLTATEWAWTSADGGTLWMGADPAALVVEAGQRLNAIDGSDSTDYIDIIGLTVKHANGDGINTDSGDNWNITSVTANENYRYGIRAGDNSDTIVINSCVGSNDNLVGIGSNAASNVTVSNSITQNNNFRSAADGMQFNGTSGLIVEYNVSSGNNNGSSSDGIQLMSSPGAIIRYNHTYDNKNTGLLLGKGAVYSYGTIHNNVFDEPTSNHCIALSGIGDGNTIVYNNVCYGAQLRINEIESPHTLTVKNNIFQAITGKAIDENTTVDDSLITMDNNLIYNNSGTMITWEGNSYTQAQFADYQSTESQDANSISSDPFLTDPTNNDFTLQSTSPAIDAGALLTIHIPGWQDNPWCTPSGYKSKTVLYGSSPDIGACETFKGIQLFNLFFPWGSFPDTAPFYN